MAKWIQLKIISEKQSKLYDMTVHVVEMFKMLNLRWPLLDFAGFTCI